MVAGGSDCDSLITGSPPAQLCLRIEHFFLIWFCRIGRMFATHFDYWQSRRTATVSKPIIVLKTAESDQEIQILNRIGTHFHQNSQRMTRANKMREFKNT
jgi:hypothetical protein